MINYCLSTTSAAKRLGSTKHGTGVMAQQHNESKEALPQRQYPVTVAEQFKILYKTLQQSSREARSIDKSDASLNTNAQFAIKANLFD